MVGVLLDSTYPFAASQKNAPTQSPSQRRSGSGSGHPDHHHHHHHHHDHLLLTPPHPDTGKHPEHGKQVLLEDGAACALGSALGVDQLLHLFRRLHRSVAVGGRDERGRLFGGRRVPVLLQQALTILKLV